MKKIMKSLFGLLKKKPEVKIPADWKCPYIYKIVHERQGFNKQTEKFNVYKRLRYNHDWTWDDGYETPKKAENYVYNKRLELYTSFKWKEEHEEVIID